MENPNKEMDDDDDLGVPLWLGKPPFFDMSHFYIEKMTGIGHCVLGLVPYKMVF
jgi:hypothetical protein